MSENTLLKCVACAKGVGCRIGEELRYCAQCRVDNVRCELLELNIPFNIVDWCCDEHREGVYEDDIEGVPV